MPSGWFRYAAERFNSASDFWTADTINASLVLNRTSINYDPSRQTIAEFNTDNSGLALANQQAFAPAVTSAPAWRNNRWEFPFQNIINFGTVADQTDIGGVLLHAGANNIGTNEIYAVQENYTIAKGADVEWGQAGDNYLAFARPVVGTQVSFRGGLNELYANANEWGTINASYQWGLALVRSVNSALTGGENTMDDFSGKVTYITGAEPGNANMPVLALGDRVTPTWNLSGAAQPENALEYFLEREDNGAQPIEWLFANGLVAGETIVGVVLFSYIPAYNDLAAWPLHYDGSPNHTILTNQNIRYGDIASGRDLIHYLGTV